LANLPQNFAEFVDFLIAKLPLRVLEETLSALRRPSDPALKIVNPDECACWPPFFEEVEDLLKGCLFRWLRFEALKHVFELPLEVTRSAEVVEMIDTSISTLLRLNVR
jgi:hypothetical protein